MSRVLSALTLLLFMLALPISGIAHEVKGPEGSVTLTITGNIHHYNRGSMAPFKDAFFKHHNIKFEKAYAFDRKMLLRLKQHKVKASVEGWGKWVEFEGPSLEDVLTEAGAMGRTYRIMALDGYAAKISLKELDAHKWILAHKADGKALGLGGRGPLWLVHDTAGKKIKAERESAWVWSVFLIEAE